MSIDLIVESLDPQTTMELTDFIVDNMWGGRRLKLEEEGITLMQFEPSGEAEESYEDSIGKVYFTSNISCQIMTEWKRFEPIEIDLRQINTLGYLYPNLVVSQNTALGTETKDIQLTYPTLSYPMYR